MFWRCMKSLCGLAIKNGFYGASIILLNGNGKMYLFLTSDSQPCEEIRLCVQTHTQNKVHKCSPNQASVPTVWLAKGVSQQTLPDTGKGAAEEGSSSGKRCWTKFTLWLQKNPPNKEFSGVPRFRVQGPLIYLSTCCFSCLAGALFNRRAHGRYDLCDLTYLRIASYCHQTQRSARLIFRAGVTALSFSKSASYCNFKKPSSSQWFKLRLILVSLLVICVCVCTRSCGI